jgi:hypothetical protein
VDGQWFAIITVALVGLIFAIWGEIQERGFQKEIRRQKELGIYPYAPGQHPDEIAERLSRTHPAE